MDSTSVLHYAVEQASERIHTFTVGFSGEEFADERPYARLAAKRYRTEHHEITFDADDFREFLPKYVWHMEEPVCEPPAVALYYVSKLARDSSVKVLLSGEGGDEAFGGYTKYRKILMLEKIKSILRSAKGIIRYGMNAMEYAGLQRIRKYECCVDLSLPQYYFSCSAMPSSVFNQKKHLIYRQEFKDLLGKHTSEEPTRRLFEMMCGKPLLNQMLYVDTKTWLPDDLLIKADKMTMATSVELRVPLLDFRVLEFAASLPTNFKVRGWSAKRILRAAIKDSIPKEIINRKKYGFPVPYDRWLKRDLKDLVFDTILSQNSSLNDYFCRDALVKILQSHQDGQNCSQEVFSLLVLDLWIKQFIDGKPREISTT